MRRTKLDFEHSRWGGLIRFATVAVILTACLPLSSMAQEEGQKTFPSAEAASRGLFTAIQSGDEKAMLVVLGPDAKEIVSSGDEVQDKEHRANFVKKYEEMHRLVRDDDLVYRGGELAHTHTARRQGQFVILRHRCGQEGNSVPANRPE
jgi:Protein of unknown function (DUF2950)